MRDTKDADNYNWVPTPSFLYRNYLYKKLASRLPKRTDFLEVGTGNGEFLKYLVKLGFKGMSLDFSDSVVSYLNTQKEAFRGVVIKKGDILKYKSNKKFDAAFCFEVLEHIYEDGKAVKNIAGLLKPNGYFFFSVPAHKKEWSIIDKTKGHFRRYEKSDIREILDSNGFRLVKILNYGFPFLNFIRAVTKKGKLIQLQRMSLKKETRTGLSSLQQEYGPKWRFLVANMFILTPLFKIMDLFLGFDLGLGYVVVARKK